MSNNSKPIYELVHHCVEHDFSHERGVITDVREDIRGYNYFVEWDLFPEHNDWFSKGVLIITPPTPSSQANKEKQ